MSSWEIRQGDVLDRLREMPDESVQMVCTSPPYYSLRDYSIAPSDWPEVTYSPMAGLPTVTVPPMTCALGLEPDVTSYIGHLVLVFREVGRVMRQDGTCFMNLGDSYVAGPTGHQDISNANGKAAAMFAKGGRYRLDNMRKDLTRSRGGLKPKDLMMVPSRAAHALQADGFYVRSEITWCKRAPMPESVKDRPTSATEKIFLLSKSERYFYDADAVREPHIAAHLQQQLAPNKDRGDSRQFHKQGLHDFLNPLGRNQWNYWLLSPEPYSEAHFATFPSEMPRRAILAGTSEHGACAECGAAWVRVVRKIATEQPISYRGSTFTNGKTAVPHANVGQGLRYETEATNEWQSTCACNAPTVPCLVLDPFAGSGTTLMVALRLGRRALGIELSEEYIRIARKRIVGDAPLFNTPVEASA